MAIYQTYSHLFLLWSIQFLLTRESKMRMRSSSPAKLCIAEVNWLVALVPFQSKLKSLPLWSPSPAYRDIFTDKQPVVVADYHLLVLQITAFFNSKFYFWFFRQIDENYTSDDISMKKLKVFRGFVLNSIILQRFIQKIIDRNLQYWKIQTLRKLICAYKFFFNEKCVLGPPFFSYFLIGLKNIYRFYQMWNS